MYLVENFEFRLSYYRRYNDDIGRARSLSRCGLLFLLCSLTSFLFFQLGTFDPLPNARNEKLVAVNFHRLKYYLGDRDASIETDVAELLGALFILLEKTSTLSRAKFVKFVKPKIVAQ